MMDENQFVIDLAYLYLRSTHPDLTIQEMYDSLTPEYKKILNDFAGEDVVCVMMARLGGEL